MAKVLRQVSLFNGTKLITNMPKFITLNCHIFTIASGQLEFQFKNMKLQISDTHIRKLFYLDPLQKY